MNDQVRQGQDFGTGDAEGKRALAHALSLHGAGQLEAAVEAYRKVPATVSNYADVSYNLALALNRLGRFDEAMETYRRIIAMKPDYAEAHNNLGILLKEQGRLDEAAVAYRQAVELKPDYAEPLNNLGVLLQDAGDNGGAIAAYRQAIAAKPDYHQALANLGNAYIAQGKMDQASGVLRQAIAIAPRFAPAHFGLARTLEATGRQSEAADAYQRAIEIDPDFGEAYNNLGVILSNAGMVADAVAVCSRAVDLRPKVPQCWFNFGNALRAAGRKSDASMAFGHAVQLAPTFAEACNNLGSVLSELGQYHNAATACQYALSLRPHYGEALCNLGIAQAGLGRVEDAAESYRQAIAAQPGLVPAYANLATVLMELGQLEGAIAAAGQATALLPDSPEALATLVHLKRHACQWADGEAETRRLLDVAGKHPGQVAPMVLLSLDTTPQQQLDCATQWSAKFEAQDDEILTAAGAPVPARDKLRIGYLSADFHDHATARLAAGLFESHDRSRVELFGYSTGPDDGSAMRARVVAAFDHFADLHGVSDAESARRIVEDGIDILVDLKGHTRFARTRILGYRPAPVQVSYLGYPGTMGAGFIDYILADSFVVPADRHQDYSEKVVSLPGTYQCNDASRVIAATPSRAACGLPEQGVVFCCFNNTFKITPAMFDVWMRLLAQVPGSVLWLLEANPLAAANLRREASARGIAADRLVFAPRLPMEQHLARYRLADLFLDTQPYGGYTTASDALWAGLPVLTCAGATFAGRVAGSLLHALGLPELVAATVAQYEAAALRLVQQPDRLASLRRRLDAARTTTTVFDPARSARDLEDAYARMWQTRAAGRAPEALWV